MRQGVFKDDDKLVSEIYLQRMNFRHYHCSNVRINEIFGHLEIFTEDIELSIASDEADQGYVAVWDLSDLWQPGIWPQGYRLKFFGSDYFQWGLPLQAAVAVVPVVECLEVFALPLQHCIA